MNDLTDIYHARRHVGRERDGSDAISFILYNTEHYMAVAKAQALADAIHAAIGRRGGAATLAERVSVLETNLQRLAEAEAVEALLTVPELAERVQVLESLNCSCQDCVMHRDKARHGRVKGKPDLPYSDSANANNGLEKGACMTHAPSEEAPAWQRAKVGDRIIVGWCDKKGDSIELVHSVDDDAFGERISIVTADNRFSDGFRSVANEIVSAICPPEPADQPDGCVILNAPLVVPDGTMIRGGTDDLEKLMARPAADSLDALKAEATSEDGPLWMAAFEWHEQAHTFHKMDVAIRSLCDRAYAIGLSGAPQTVTVTRDQLHEISVKHWYGLSVNDIVDGLRLIPGIDVVEG